MRGGIDRARSIAPNVNNLISTADAAAIVIGHNALLAALRTGGLLAPNLTYDQMVLAASGLQAYYIFGEPSGTASIDALAARNGAYSGSPTLGVAGPLPDDPHTAVTFASASSQYMHSAYGFGGDPMTAMLFIKRTTISATMYLFDAGADRWSAVIQAADNKITFVWEGHTGMVTSSAGLTDTSAWHHIAMTKNGNAESIYIDGVRTDATTSATISASTELYVGIQRVGASPLNASMSRVAIFNRALTPTEVAAFYARSLVP